MVLPTRTVTGTYRNTLTGEAMTGEVQLDPYPLVWHDTVGDVVRAGGGIIALVGGGFSEGLVTTDAAGVDPPTGRLWRITERLTGQPERSRFFTLPLGDGTPQDVTDLVVAQPGTLTYLPVTGATGPAGAPGAAGAAGATGATGAAGPQPPLGAAGAGPTIALKSDDATTANARVPTAHAATHATAGTDPVTPTSIGAETPAGATSKADAAQAAAISAAATDATTKANAAQAAATAAIPSAATTVTAETAYGQVTVTGTSGAYARQDHTHGSPALTSTAPATTEGIGQAAAVGTATTPARADHVHPMAAAGAPAASAVTSTQVTGAASTYAASDHVHAREGFGAVTAQTAFAAVSATGTALTVAHSDHAHGTPTLPTATVSTTGVVQLDGTATDITALGTQAAGATGKAADAGHVHPATGVLLLAGGTMTGTTNATLLNGTAVMDASLASGDTFDRYRRDASGREERGSGSIARDTFWYRSGPGVMTTDGLIAVGGGDPTADNHLTRRAWVEEQNGWGLADYIAAGSAIKAWTGSPGYSTSGAFTFGQIKLTKLWLRNVATLSTVTIFVTTAGVGLTSGQNLVAILDASGTQLAISADQTTAWASTGPKPAAMTVPIANAAAGGYYVAVLCNGATSAISVTMHTNSNTSALNFGLTAANGRCLSSASSANTTIPASIALGSQTLAASNFMAVIT